MPANHDHKPSGARSARARMPAHPPWRQLAALSLAMLLPSLGTSIVNVTLPTLAVSFAAPIQQVQWAVLAYLLTTTSLIVGAGRLGDRVGRRRLLLAATALFALASVGSGIAPALWAVVLSRALQGVAAAAMMALTLAAVGDVVPKEQTGRAMGLLGSVSTLGTALGPSLGGVLTAALGWRSAFFAMAVAGATAFALVRALPSDRRNEKNAGLDPAGTLLLTLSLAGYALTMTQGGAAPSMTALLAGLTVAGLGAFIFVEARVGSPLIQIALLRDRVLAGSLIEAAIVSTVVMATLVVGPLYLTRTMGLGPAVTGLVTSVGPIIAALTGIPAGRMVDRAGAFEAALVGLVGVTAGASLMAFLPGAFGVAGYVGALATITAAYALFQAANNTMVMRNVAGDQRGLRSALLGLARNLGLITGASMMGALFAAGSHDTFPSIAEGQSGLRLTFGVAAVLAAMALGVALWSRGHQARSGRRS
ncbi:MAG TPA: MFS transporter [Bauldia sp.]|nr:MFS transporter [Bauldia sp.]